MQYADMTVSLANGRTGKIRAIFCEPGETEREAMWYDSLDTLIDGKVRFVGYAPAILGGDYGGWSFCDGEGECGGIVIRSADGTFGAGTLTHDGQVGIFRGIYRNKREAARQSDIGAREYAMCPYIHLAA